MHITIRTAVLIAAAAALAACGADGDARAAADAAPYRGWLVDEPRPKPDFTLTDTEGAPFDFRAETRGLLTLVFFGYTHCPDICPVHMANLGAVMRELRPSLARQIRVVFVTTDPERDTPERMRGWLDSFYSDFIGLTGEFVEINRIQREIGLPAAQLGTPDSAGRYEVGHSAFVVAFTPDGFGRLVYPFGIRQADWAHDLPRLLEAEWDVPTAQSATSEPVVVSNPYAAEPVTSEMTAVYFTVTNHTTAGDTLDALSAAVAERGEFHEQVTEGAFTRMEPRPHVPVPARTAVVFQPGGLHGMLMGLRSRPQRGDTLHGTLRFRSGRTLRVAFPVVPYDEIESRAAAAGDGHDSSR